MKNLNFTSGWSFRNTRANRVLALVLVMMTLNQQVFANQEVETSIEFLEYLGSGVTVEKEFLDPMNYSEIDAESLSDKKQNAEIEDRKNGDE